MSAYKKYLDAKLCCNSQIASRGPQGPHGEQGPQGLVGLAGYTGPQGSQGLKGLGQRGQQGPQGTPGGYNYLKKIALDVSANLTYNTSPNFQLLYTFPSNITLYAGTFAINWSINTQLNDSGLLSSQAYLYVDFIGLNGNVYSTNLYTVNNPCTPLTLVNRSVIASASEIFTVNQSDTINCRIHFKANGNVSVPLSNFHFNIQINPNPVLIIE
jgi:hypothetical protein